MNTRPLEYCFLCDEPTGRAGAADDSIYLGSLGPFCEECYDRHKADDERSRFNADLARLRAIEAAARDVADQWFNYRYCGPDRTGPILALLAALEPEASRG